LHDPPRAKSPISLPFVVLASLLMGLGIFAMAIWLVTLNWIWFGGILPILTGALMLFDRRAGAESAS
jgi:cytochrome c biogenesis factor